MASVSNSVKNHNPKSKSIQEKVFMFDDKKERNLRIDELERASFFTETTLKKFPEDYISRQSHADSHNYLKNETKERIATASKFTGKSKESSSKRNLKTEFSGSESKQKSKVEMLEQELIETAAMEVGLYSIVAEHESSMNKVHTPARRLSRFYLHNSCKSNSHIQLGSASRAIISGLVLVSKSCGNDVPRLTFWLSNAIMLRAIISQSENADSDGWEDTESFIYALEKTESWIFSRIIESIWWQTLTQYMQPTVAKTNCPKTKKSNSSKYRLGDQEKGSFSVELWNKAFKDACERICPIRAQGNECGCLSVMTRMIMEQLVIRLDVAMFNAILRESAEEMPSDPLSDPITEPRVLPIVAGKLSFGAGAQLKNAIGNWTRWLSDLFETDDDDECFCDETKPEFFKAFRLLNALSDVMMLPYEMLTDKSTRKEVCPALGSALIKRVFNSFLPDQFCPYPIPKSVIDALDSEDDSDTAVNSHPWTAAATVYSPPVVTSLKFKGFTLEVGNHNVTSDDELDEMSTNLNLIFNQRFRFREKPSSSSCSTSTSSTATKLGLFPKGDSKTRVVRYNLLGDIWKKF